VSDHVALADLARADRRAGARRSARRTEEEIDDWCAARGRERGGVVPAGRLFGFAARWYGGRLAPDWRPRDREASQALLAGAGLTGPFWTL
jgi:hypothetical protein